MIGDRLEPQVLDALRVSARIRHPAFTIRDPEFLGLRRVHRNPDVIELERDTHELLSFCGFQGTSIVENEFWKLHSQHNNLTAGSGLFGG